MLKRNFLPQLGFTLVELLIVMLIMVLFLGIGLVGLRSYGDQRSVSLAASDFATDVRLAKSRAQSQVKPSSGSCLTLPLEGYRVTLIINSQGIATGYSINPVCGGQISAAVRQGSFLSSLTVRSTHSMVTFRTLTGIAEREGNPDSPTIVTFTGPNNQNATVTIYRDGRVEGGI